MTASHVSLADVERESFKARADTFASLIWNQGNDLEFLDAVLADMTTEEGRVSERHLRHVFRFTAMRLADELRIVFPGRPRLAPEIDAHLRLLDEQ